MIKISSCKYRLFFVIFMHFSREKAFFKTKISCFCGGYLPQEQEILDIVLGFNF